MACTTLGILESTGHRKNAPATPVLKDGCLHTDGPAGGATEGQRHAPDSMRSDDEAARALWGHQQCAWGVTQSHTGETYYVLTDPRLHEA